MTPQQLDQAFDRFMVAQARTASSRFNPLSACSYSRPKLSRWESFATSSFALPASGADMTRTFCLGDPADVEIAACGRLSAEKPEPAEQG